MSHLLGNVTAVLMTRSPGAPDAKTRLGPAGPHIAEAMLACIARRLDRAAGRLVLAVTPDGTAAALAATLGLAGASVADQGSGDLGRRLDRVWRQAGAGRPIAFFGGDSPDVPDEALAAIPAALASCDVAAGPTGDGGYWTLAARAHYPQLLADIDWGGPSVYDQTLQRAASSGLVVGKLPQWHDVDRPADVEALRARLGELVRSAAPSAGTRPLWDLAEQLETLVRQGTPS